jgi:hypothetical protein
LVGRAGLLQKVRLLLSPQPFDAQDAPAQHPMALDIFVLRFTMLALPAELSPCQPSA